MYDGRGAGVQKGEALEYLPAPGLEHLRVNLLEPLQIPAGGRADNGLNKGGDFFKLLEKKPL
jgi:hypothetical protein